MSNIEKTFDIVAATPQRQCLINNTPATTEALEALYAIDSTNSDNEMRIAVVNLLFASINENMSTTTLVEYKKNLAFLIDMAEASLSIQRKATPADQLLFAPPATTDAQGALVHEYDQIALAGTLLQNTCHGAAHRAGWWDHKKTGFDLKRLVQKPEGPLEELLAGALIAQKLCLIHSEVTEAMEGDRKNLMDDKLPHRSMLEVELADVVIRAMDLAGAKGLDLGGAIAEKMQYNSVRLDHRPEARNAVNGKSY